MPNVMGVLRSEIRRLARKETRDEIRALRKQVNALRLRLAEARRRIDSVERQAKTAGARRAVASAPARDEKQVRFSPAWVRSHRKKLRLSRLQYGKLVGVSAQTILGWETGRSRPRRKILATWRSLREKGLRELKAMLGAAAGAGARGRRTARRKLRKVVRRARRAVRKAVRTRVRRTVRKATRKRVVRRARRKVSRARARRGRSRRK